MAATPRGGYIVPNQRIPRMIGILNITFAAQLLIVGLCGSVYAASLPFTMRAMTNITQKVEQDAQAKKKVVLDRLEEDEKAATTEEQKATIREGRKRAEAAPSMGPMVMDITKMRLDDPKMTRWSISDMATMLILNVLMLVSGIGLLGFRRWARSLAIWTCWLKVIRLALVWGYFAFAVVPEMSQRVAEMVGGMFAAQGVGTAPPVEMLVRIYTITYTVMGLGTIVFGSIYPLVMFFCLTRPSVRAAFTAAAAPKPPTEPQKSW